MILEQPFDRIVQFQWISYVISAEICAKEHLTRYEDQV